MNFGYIENPETHERKDVVIRPHSVIKGAIAGFIVGVIIGIVDNMAYKDGAEAYDRELNKTLGDLGLLDQGK